MVRKFISNISCLSIKYPNVISSSGALNVIQLQLLEVASQHQVFQRWRKDSKSSYKKTFLNHTHTDDGISFILNFICFSPCQCKLLTASPSDHGCPDSAAARYVVIGSAWYALGLPNWQCSPQVSNLRDQVAIWFPNFRLHDQPSCASWQRLPRLCA